MLPPNQLALAIGLACVVVSVWVVRKLSPREGGRESAWVRTELRAFLVTLVVMIMLIAGIGLLFRGVTA